MLGHIINARGDAFLRMEGLRAIIIHNELDLFYRSFHWFRSEDGDDFVT